MKKRAIVQWLAEPEAHDYPAAESYLTLTFDPATAKAHIGALRGAPMSEYAAKDILRASGLPLLPLTNSHVKKDEKKILGGAKLSPLLLVRHQTSGRLIIADGYHRLCAVYAFDEDAMIPCKLVG